MQIETHSVIMLIQYGAGSLICKTSEAQKVKFW